MHKNLPVILSAAGLIAGTVTCVVLLSMRADQQKEKEWEAAQRRAAGVSVDRMARERQEREKVRERLEAQRRNPPAVNVDRFLADAGAKGTRHEKAVRERFGALTTGEQQQAMMVADWMALLGRKKFDDDNSGDLDRLQDFYLGHKDLFPQP